MKVYKGTILTCDARNRVYRYPAEKGIGMIHSVSGVGYTLDLDVDMEHWFAKGLNNGLQLRVYFQTMDVL